MHRHLNLAQWAHAHPLLSAVIVAMFAIAVWTASRSGRSIQRRHHRALAAQGRRARSLGLDLSYREAELLARLERRWWRRGRR